MVLMNYLKLNRMKQKFKIHLKLQLGEQKVPEVGGGQWSDG